MAATPRRGQRFGRVSGNLETRPFSEEWQRRQERARTNLRNLSFANSVRSKQATLHAAQAALIKLRVLAPIKIMKGSGPGTWTLALRVAMAAVRSAKRRVLGKAKDLPVTALITGAALGEVVSEVFDDDIPVLAQQAPAAAKEIIRATGETFGLQAGVQDLVQALQVRMVAVYLGKRLLTAVRVEVAELLLNGMKRNTRDRVRVR